MARVFCSRGSYHCTTAAQSFLRGNTEVWFLSMERFGACALQKVDISLNHSHLCLVSSGGRERGCQVGISVLAEWGGEVTAWGGVLCAGKAAEVLS